MDNEKLINNTKTSLWQNLFKYADDLTILSKKLSTFPAFETFSNKELKTLASIVQIREFLKGETIFIKDDPGICMYIIDSGTVEIFDVLKNKEKQVLALLNSGDYFGEMNLLVECRRMANAVALENTKTLILFRPDILELIDRESDLGKKIMIGTNKILVEKILSFNDDYNKLLESFIKYNSEVK